MRITSSRDEFGPPEISIRCPVVDSSTLLEQQSSGCDHHYIHLIYYVRETERGMMPADSELTKQLSSHTLLKNSIKFK